ncbi:MAG TPA: CHAT domain-containing protein, partial [Myxococcales bacterium]
VKTDAPDLLALQRKLSQLTLGRLEEHARLYRLYQSLRGRAVAGTADVKEVEEFSRFVALDPALWAPALQLAAYVHAARGDWRAAQRYDASIALGCPARGCALENQAIALDELADAAGRDGDLPAARQLQARAEAIFTSAGAALQLAELHRKRAGLLLEEKRLDEAAQSAALAVRELADSDRNALAAAVGQAAEIAARRGQRSAATELSEASLELARAAGNRDLEVDAAASLARNSAQPGGLLAEIRQLEDAGHQSGAASLRATLAEILLAQGDKAGARAESERGLAAAGAGAWTSERVRLLLAHARAGGSAAELSDAVSEAARAAAGSGDPVALLETARDAALELARASKGLPAEEQLLPMDRLRAAALGVPPAAPGWSRQLPPGACVLAQMAELRVVVSPDGQLDRCEEVWIFSDEPVELSGRFAVGLATSLTRLIAPEPAPPRSALLVSSPSLPGMNREKEALRAMGASVVDLPGARALPESVLEQSRSQPLLHFAVHGLEGGFLQLAGDGGRLAAREVAQMRLLPGARVVLSACHAGMPGPRGLAWAFARAGASAVAAARDEVDDAAAARWSTRFYAALGRGLSFVRANREAASEARFVVVK